MSPVKPSFRGPTPSAGVRWLGPVTYGRRIPPACVPRRRIFNSPWRASSSGLNFFSSLRPASLAVLCLLSPPAPQPPASGKQKWAHYFARH
ncbi:hypothetical protein ACQJBY_049072 [Aegilops geniculata]